MVQALPSSEAIEGLLWGMAVGDALGLPYEGLSPRRARKLFGPPDRHRFAFGRGIISDDTEHAVLTAESIVASAGEVSQFRIELRKRLRNWFLSLPPGIGMATLKASLKMCLTPPHWASGVFSAGNGPAMRAIILGVVARDDEHLREIVRVSTELTHLDPKAYYGALIVALAARESSSQYEIDPEGFLSLVDQFLPDDAPANELRELIRQAADFDQFASSLDFASATFSSRGVSGYIYETVPFVIHCWLRNPDDFALAVQQAILAGGDTDTTAAILGGIIGARTGVNEIPGAWRKKTCLWPISHTQIQLLAVNLSVKDTVDSGNREGHLPIPGTTLLKNLIVIPLVLLHGVRRLAPPY